MDMSASLAWLLAQTGAKIYPLERKIDSTLPALVYRTISDQIKDTNHSVAGSIHRSRVQITHVASTYPDLVTLVGQVRALLEGNRTTFSAALASDVHVEDKEADGIFTAVKDYMIFWKA